MALSGRTWRTAKTYIRIAAGSGIGLHPLGPHAWAHEAAPALLLGYAGLSAAEITLACRLLGPCIERALREGPA